MVSLILISDDCGYICAWMRRIVYEGESVWRRVPLFNSISITKSIFTAHLSCRQPAGDTVNILILYTCQHGIWCRQHDSDFDLVN